MRALASFVVALGILASSALAQDVSFSGKVEDGEGVCYYCPGFDFVLDNTHVSLNSPSIPLLPLVGQYVSGTGSWNGSTTKPVITVTSIHAVPESFSIGGGGSIGNDLKFTAVGAPGSQAIIVMAFKDGFTPFGSWGCLFLDPTQLFVLGQGTIAGDGEFKVKIEIPDVPALIGLPVFGQGAVIPVNGTLLLTNSDLKIIS